MTDRSIPAASSRACELTSLFVLRRWVAAFGKGGNIRDLLLCRGAHLHDILTLVQEYLETFPGDESPKNESVRQVQ